MTHVIFDLCIRDGACTEVCPVECIIPGIPEALRADGIGRGIAMAQLSRGVAGSVGSSLIINLPGSPGAVREGLAVLGPVLAHALAQLAGAQRSRHA